LREGRAVIVDRFTKGYDWVEEYQRQQCHHAEDESKKWRPRSKRSAARHSFA